MAPLQGVKEIFMTTDGACTAFQRRPFLKDFLEEVCQLFEVAIFTAGSRVSARLMVGFQCLIGFGPWQACCRILLS